MGYFDNLAAKTKSAAVNAKKKKEDEEENKARARAQRAAARPAQTQKSSAVSKAAGNIKKAYQAPAEKTKKAVQNESAHFRADRIARERQEDSNQLYARLNHGRGRAAYEERTRQAAETKSKAGDRGRRAFDMQGNLKENLQNMRQEKMGRYLDKNHQSAREQYQNRGRKTYLAGEGAHNWNDTFDVGADKALLSSADYQTIQQLKQQWQAARRRGDTRGEDEAHRQAEQIRMKYGYSGGAGGGAYNEVSEVTSSDVVAKRRQTNEYNLKTARENLAELERQGADRNSDTYRAARRRYQEARQRYLDAAGDEADYLNSLYQYGVPGQALPQLSDSREINRQLRDELAREGMQYSSNPYTREQNRGEIARIEDARADLWQLDRAEGNVRNAALEQAAADYVREHGREALAAYRRDDNESALVNRGEAVRGYMQPLLAGEYAGNEAEALARYMTQEERDTYNYLRKTKGREAASEYLSDTVERRNERWGQEIAREQEGNLFNQIMYGFVSGMDRTIGGAAQLFREDAVPTSHVQYAGERVREDLADKGPKILGSSLGQVAYDLANTTGNQLPQMGVAALTGGMGAPGWLTQLASSGLTTATVGGSSYSEKIREGYTPEQARSYAVISGALEGGLQYVLDGIRLTGKGAIPRAVQTRLQGIESGAARFAARYGSSMLSEGLEEGLQEILEPFVASATLDETYTPAQLSDVLYSFLLGAVSAGVLEGPTALAEAADTRERGEAILQLGQETVDAIVADGMRKAPGSTGRVLAEKIRGKQQAGESITPQILGALWRETRTEIGENIPVTQGQEQKLDPVWEAAAEERTDGMPFDTEATLSDTEESPLYRAALDAERETFPETGRYTPEENPLAERTEAAPAKQVMTAAPMTAQTMAAGAGKTRRVTETPSRNVMEARADLEKVDRMASTLGRAGSAMFRRAYDADMAMTMDANTAFEGYSSVYYNRLTGQEIPEAAQSAVSALPPDLYRAAAAAGETDARAARQAKYFGKDAGLVRDRTFRKARVNSRTARALDAFAKSTGIQIRFADSIRTERGDEANASYNGGVLTIARDTESPVMTVTSHETVHRIREAAPEAYGALASFVLDNMSGETFGAVYNRYSEAYRTGNFDTISEELVAEAFGEMMSKGELLEEFFAADRSAGQKILDTLRDIINAIRKTLSQNKGVLLSAEEARTFRELEKNLGEMADAFEAALAKVSRKAEAREGNAGQIHSENDTIDQQRYSVKLGKQEYAQIQSARMRKYGGMKESDIPSLDYVFAHDNFYVVRNYALDSYAAVLRLNPANKQDDIDLAMEVFKSGSDRTEEIFGRGAGSFRAWKRRDIRYSGNSGHTGTGAGNDSMAAGTARRKTTNRKRDSDSGSGDGGTARFQLKKAVEETKTLVAVHNFKESDLRDTLKLGAWPSPSIAIVKAETGHAKYGDYSVVFPRGTIDPEADPKNRAYGSDAWTPTHSNAQIDYPVDYDKLVSVEQDISSLAREVANGIFDSSSVLRSLGVDDDTNMSADELADRLAERETVRAAYLAEHGETLEPVMRAKEWDKYGNDALSRFAEAVGEKRLAEINDRIAQGEGIKALGADAKTIESILRNYYRDAGESLLQKMAKKRGWTADEIREKRQARINRSMENVSVFTMEDFARHAYEMILDGGKTKGEIDRSATREALFDQTDRKAVKDWAARKIEGLLGEPGIYNGKNLFTSSGNRRTFKQLHYPYTVENIVKAMNNSNDRGVGYWGVGGEGLQAMATTNFRTVDEMHAEEDRLSLENEEEHRKRIQELDKQIDTIVTAVKRNNKPHSDNSFDESQIIGSILMDTAEKGKTKAKIQNAFQKEGYRISDELAGQILAAYQSAANIPTGYFEAKPKRVVGFDEALRVIAPDNAPYDVIDGMKQAGLDVVTYPTGDEGERLRLLNTTEGARFSLKNKKMPAEETAEKSPAESGGEKYSFKKYSQHQIDNWKNSKNIEVFQNEAQFENFIQDAIDGKNLNKKIYFGAITKELASRIKNDTGISVENYNCTLRASEVRKILKVHGRETTEATRGHRAVSKEDFFDIPAVIEDPDRIYLSNKLFEGKPVIVFEKTIDDKNTVVSYVSKKHMDLTVQTMYIGKQKGNLSTAADAKAPAFTPKANVGTVPSGSNISQNPSESKPKTSLKSATRAEQEAIALVRENERLKERVEYWKGQIKRSAPGSVNPASVKRTASELARDFASKVDRKELTRMLQALYDTMGARKAAGETDVYAGIRETAESIAQWIVEEAVEKGAFFREYEDLIKHMKKTVIQVPDWVKADIPDFSQWKVGKGIRISKNGLPIDVAYQELSQLFPGWFDEQKEITGSDQLLRIADVLGTIYSNEHVNPFEGHYDQAVTEVSNEILNRFFSLPENQTFADRMERKLAAEKQKRKDAVSAQREKSKKQWEKERAKLMDRYHEMIRNVREDRERKLAALRQEQRERTRAGRERQKARELRAQITRHVSRMSQQLLKPTDRQHVPEEMRGAVATLLHAINLESRERDGADPTKKTLAFRELRDSYERIMESGGYPLVYNPDLADGDLFRRVIEMGDTPILAMNSGQLEDIWQAVRAVEHAITTAGKTLTRSKYQTTEAWADEMQQAAKTRKQKKSKLSLDLELPVTFFSRFGDAGGAVYQMLRDAQDKRTTILSDMFDRVQKEMPKGYDIRKARRDVREFTLESGDRVTLSRSNVMDLYNAYQREQGRSHLLQEGITQPEIKNKKIAEGSNKMALTQGDLDLIFQFLTKADRQMAETLQKLTAPLSDYGNEASMQAYGYQKFTEENYWPLKVASAALPTKVETLADARRSIANIGFSKATKENAGNALRLGDAFDIFAKHVIDMSLYASYLCPIEDAMRLYNYNFSRFDEMRNEWVRTGKTVKGIFDDVGGPRAQTYFTNLMADIQNEFKGYDTETEKVINRIVGAGKGAAVGLNLRVVLQQPTAIMRAVAVLNPAYLAKGMTGGATKGNGWAKAKRYAPIAQWKDWGSFDISRGPQIESLMYGLSTASEKIQNATGFLAGAADAVTWGAIWNACEWQVKARNKSVTPGTEAYYQKVASLFGDVINQSQVVDGVLQRSQIMRSSSSLIQQATAFQGEPIMTLNLLMRAWDKVRYEKDPKKKAAGRKLVSRAVTAIILNGVANALAQSIMDGIRDDDEDKKYLERVMTAFTGLSGDEKSLKDYAVSILKKGNVGDNLNMLSNVPFVRDALSLLEGYDVSRMDADVFAGIINDGKYLIQALQGDNKKTVFDTASALLGSAAKLFGLPVSTVKRDVLGFVRSFAVESDNLALQYELAKLQYQLGSGKNLDRFVKYLTRAEAAGDQALYDRIYNDLMARGVMPKEIEEKKKENLKKSLGKDHLTTIDNYLEIAAGYTIAGDKESEESWLDQATAQQQRTYYEKKREFYADMMQELPDGWSAQVGTDQQQDAAAKRLLQLADEMAKMEADNQYTSSKAWINNAKEGEAFGLTPAQAALYEALYDSSTGTDENGDGKADSGARAAEAKERFTELFPDASASTVAYVQSLSSSGPKEISGFSKENRVKYFDAYGTKSEEVSGRLDENERSYVSEAALGEFEKRVLEYSKNYALGQVDPSLVTPKKIERKGHGVASAYNNPYEFVNEGVAKGYDAADLLLFEAIYNTTEGVKNANGKTEKKQYVIAAAKKQMPWISTAEFNYMYNGYWKK